MPFASRSLAGTVLGVPDAENLKFIHEFSLFGGIKLTRNWTETF